MRREDESRRTATDSAAIDSAPIGGDAIAGTVRAQLPSGLYEVEIDGPQRVTAHVGGGLERNFVRLVVGDRVLVALMPRDRTRGRIVRKTG